jgi:CRISPR-associated protein Csb2
VFLLAGSEAFDRVPLQVAMMVMNEQTELSLGLLPTVAELALSGRTLPHLTRAVVVGEALRRAALALHRVPSATLAGKDADGMPLTRQHRHAHYVADCRGAADPVHGGPLRITHVVVYAPGGLTPSEVTALLGVRYLPSYVYGTEVAETEPLAVTLGGLGQVAGLHGSRLGQRSTVFASRTPFVLPRHRKRGDEPEEQLVRELRLRGLPIPRQIERTLGPLGLAESETPPWSVFLRHRRHDELTTGYYGFRIEFAEAVSGPLLLGYGCHYGLGQFVPYAE